MCLLIQNLLTSSINAYHIILDLLVQVSFHCQFNTSLCLLRRESHLRDCLEQVCLWGLSWLLIDIRTLPAVGNTFPWEYSPGLYYKGAR